MKRSFRVLETTDRQHLGLVFEIDDDNRPGVVNLPGGDVFVVQQTAPMGDGVFRVSNANYVAFILELTNG